MGARLTLCFTSSNKVAPKPSEEVLNARISQLGDTVSNMKAIIASKDATISSHGKTIKHQEGVILLQTNLITNQNLVISLQQEISTKKQAKALELADELHAISVGMARMLPEK